MLSEQGSPNGKPYCASGKPCSYSAWPASCRQLQVISLKSNSLMRVVIRTSCGLKAVLKGCSLTSCRPQLKSNCNFFKSSIPQIHWSSLGKLCFNKESSTC